MAVDFDAIRRKLSQISGNNKKRDAFWKPNQDVIYHVRVLPFKDNDGQPLKERYFYYGIGKNPGLLTPNQFGKRDPIQELINRLREEGTPESRELCKKLYPKMRAYAPVIVRGEENLGPRLWAFGKGIYQDILNIILDEDYGDITDPIDGRDLKVVVTKPPGAQWAKTDVTPRVKTSVLSDDPKQAQTWIDSVPDLDSLFDEKSYEELSNIVNEWLVSPGDDEGSSFKGSESTGSTRGGRDREDQSESKTHDDLDAAFAGLVDD